MIFHKGKIAETYNIGGFNEWKNIDIIKVVIKTVDRLLGRPDGADLDLITYVTDRKGHDMRYAIDSRKLQKELGWEPSLQFEEGIEETVKWYLDNLEWIMLLLGSIRSIMRICIRIDNVFFRKPTRPSLPLRKAPHLSPSLSLARRERM